jgi:hypothetical protein
MFSNASTSDSAAESNKLRAQLRWVLAMGFGRHQGLLHCPVIFVNCSFSLYLSAELAVQYVPS